MALLILFKKKKKVLRLDLAKSIKFDLTQQSSYTLGTPVTNETDRSSID
jgi:hypothetical protein